MKTKNVLTAWVLLACSPIILAQDTPTGVLNGNTDDRNTIYALEHATIHVDASRTIKDGAVLIQNERIIGINATVPDHAVVKDYTGMHIYPGFIHLDASVGLPDPEKRPPFSWGGKETIQSTTPGAYNSNEAIKAAFDAAKHYTTDAKGNQALRTVGFTAALSHRKDGVIRGTSVLTHLADQAEETNIIKAQAAMHHAFDKGSSKQDYPISLMGYVALIRQTWLDAQWYTQQDEMVDFDLAAINANQNLPKIIEVNNWQQTLLAAKIANEFDTRFVVRTGADSYKNLAAIKQTGQTLVVPLSTPGAPAIHDELDVWNIDFNDLKEWEVAPHNPAFLEQQDIRFALVPDDGEKGLKTFLKDLRQAHKKGLSRNTILASLTSIPADILGASELGTIANNKWANLVVTDGPLLDKNTQIAETWVAGQAYEVSGIPSIQSGQYQLSVNDEEHKLKLTNQGGKLKVSATDKDSELKYKLTTAGQFVNMVIEDGDDSHTYSGVINNRAIMPLGDTNWQMKRLGDLPTKGGDNEQDSVELPSIPSPFSAYGLQPAAKDDAVLITGATVWTNEADGILENTDVLVVNGKIKAIGSDLSAGSDTRTIDGSGMHLTSGIIDEHAHIALLSVNDVAVNSSMVRMQDAVNNHDINIYRNLAGGVTAAQLLHGSANPIGGQSALIKLKWGVQSPEDLLIDGADGYIKFALGENVKRSRSHESIRYPLTRMGVEQVYRDAFTQARAYEKAWADYNKLSSRNKKKTTAPRRDLAMEATLEVLNQDRFVSCHSYVQSEINMLMHVAEDFGFNVNTFTHILEGYKVADKMQQHGVGGSTFADWWAYKWEVRYAIPYNAALMNDAGVVTAINSDSAEMSRRLNQEAAKTVKYGGLSEQEAWKMVTLNPAKLLHLDDRMGSIKVGKDADLVLWSEHPLSIYAKAEKTLVDGVVYYDRSLQPTIEANIAKEKARLIELSKNAKGKKSNKKSMPAKSYECESITGYHEIDQLFFQGAAQ